jgi:hypothetical protein
VTSNSVKLSWELGSIRRRIDFYFVIELAEQGQASQVVFNGTGTSFVVTNLKPSTNYDVYLSYYTSSGRHAYVSKYFSTTVATTASPINPDNNKPKDDNSSTIIGAVVGVVLGLLIVILIVAFIIIRRKRRLAKSASLEFDYGAPSGGKRRPTIGLTRIGSGITMRDTSRNSTNPTYSETSSDASISPSLKSTQEMSPPFTP